MKIKEAILACMIICICMSGYSNTDYVNLKATLSGKVTDGNSGKPLPGVNVYIPDLKTGTITDSNGVYRIDNLPTTVVKINVSLTGYKLIVVIADLRTTSQLDFKMEESINELHEIVVTGMSIAAENNRTPTPITTIPQIELLQRSSTNIIDAISMEPGISQITTGAGISKPVIRGLGFNRIVTVHDGIRQEGQQWGDEHGIEIDEYSISKVEILKGPASLAFGSDALAGVVHLFSAPTFPEGTMRGHLLANYQSNNGLIGISGNLAGNEQGFIWDARYSHKRAHAYQNRYDGFVLNSGFKESSLSAILGLNKSWGYSHLHISGYELNAGIPEGERDSATGSFIKFIDDNGVITEAIAQRDDFLSYQLLIPFQKVNHLKAVINNSFVVNDGSLKITLGWQQNDRKEFSEIFDAGQYGLFFRLHTINYDLRYHFADQNNFDLVIGANGMKQSSLNKGSEFLIPEYDLLDIGVFGIAKKKLGNLDISTGIRYDSRNQDGEDLYLDSEGNITSPDQPGSIRRFKAFHSIYTGISGSVGATYQLSDHVFTKVNAARGYRAPNIAEISSNGVHEGTINYIIGVPELKPETSFQLDYALGLNTEHITGELATFTSSIDNFIFLSKLESAFGGDSISDGYQTFKYAAGDASLSGFEVSLDIHPHPLDWLHFENSFSFVQAKQKNQPDSLKHLPFIPAPRWISEVRITADKLWRSFANPYFSIVFDHTFKQERIYAAFDTETDTPGYSLINIGLGADVISGAATLFSIYLNVMNLTDVGYQSHLNRLKYAPENNASGRRGIFNMGRNVSFKIVIPLSF